MGGLSLEDLWRSQRKGSWEVSAQGIMGGLSLKNHWRSSVKNHGRSQPRGSWEVSFVNFALFTRDKILTN